MANKHRNIDKDELLTMAYRYCDYCIASTKEIATNSGVKQVKERHIPTVSYFLLHWLRREHFDFYTRGNWYVALKDESHPLFGKSIVMTGFRDKKIIEELPKFGAKLGSSVSKNTFVVLVKDKDETTGKVAEAKKLGVAIMTPEEFTGKYLV